MSIRAYILTDAKVLAVSIHLVDRVVSGCGAPGFCANWPDALVVYNIIVDERKEAVGASPVTTHCLLCKRGIDSRKAAVAPRQQAERKADVQQLDKELTRFNKIAIQGTPQMAVD